MNTVNFCFFDYFLTISKFSIFWTVQEEPGRLSGGILRGPGGVRGGPGESWEGLGRSWAGLEAILEGILRQDDFWIDLGVVLGAQGGGKLSPSWTQIGPKSKTEKKMRKEALQNLLGEVLGRSWSRLGTILGHLGRT